MEELTGASIVVFFALKTVLSRLLQALKLYIPHLYVVTEHDEPSLNEEWAELFDLLLLIVTLRLSF